MGGFFVMNAHKISTHKIGRDFFAGRRRARDLNNRFITNLQFVTRLQSTPFHAAKRQVFARRAAIDGMTFALQLANHFF